MPASSRLILSLLCGGSDGRDVPRWKYSWWSSSVEGMSDDRMAQQAPWPACVRITALFTRARNCIFRSGVTEAWAEVAEAGDAAVGTAASNACV